MKPSFVEAYVTVNLRLQDLAKLSPQQLQATMRGVAEVLAAGRAKEQK